jgi:4-alpha-glucanotransferase
MTTWVELTKLDRTKQEDTIGMVFPRASGILLHPTSFPGRFGIGDLGDAAFAFVDFLAAARQQLWQIMPLGPTGYGDSPYQALSAFAGNPLVISLERLAAQHYLADWDLATAPAFPEQTVDYGAVVDFKGRMLRLSYDNFEANVTAETRARLDAFIAANCDWLADYALFAALKEHHGGASWDTWAPDIATRQPAALAYWRETLAGSIRYHQYLQFQFFEQWGALKQYANEHGIRIIGDIPIFVAYDSADAWAHPDLFYFDAAGRPTVVAGVPPDYFSPTGQLWGNPVYRWDVMARQHYAWWIARVRNALQWIDIVRLDHFRGFQAGWVVPAGESTAENGKWVKGPGAALFRALEAALGTLPIIAEDLGLITPAVEALRDALGLPGMKVLQFAFSGEPGNLYLPHNHVRHCVVYTGTHDNDTTRGWFEHAGPAVRRNVQLYLARHGDDIAWDFIRVALMSVADTAIFPLQDVLNLGSEARMNAPGQPSGNWGWRYAAWMLDDHFRDRLRGLTELYDRAPMAAAEEEADQAA